MKWCHVIWVILVMLASVSAAESKAEPKVEEYRVRDFRSACEYLLEQAVSCAPEIHLIIDDKVLSEQQKQRLFYLLPIYRIAELKVYVLGDQYRLIPEYKSCVRMLAYVRGYKQVKLTPTETQALQVAEQVLTDVRKEGAKTPAQMARALHDWIVLHSEYDSANADFNKKHIKGEYNPFDGKYLFLNHKGVCDSYVQAYWLLLQMSGVPCSMMSGVVRSQDMGHAWMLVYLDDHWAHVDPTFDDPVPDRKGQVIYRYYDKTDADMEQDRTWERDFFPGARADGLFAGEVLQFVKLDDLLSHLRSQKGECVISADVEELRMPDRCRAIERLRAAALQVALPGTLSAGQHPFYPQALRIRYRTDTPLSRRLHIAQ